jgi:glycosyltransferase involved in cell wall biosynthesis
VLQSRGDDVVVFTSPLGLPAGKEQTARPGDVRVVELPLTGWGSIGAVVNAMRREDVAHAQFEYSGYAWGRWGFAFWVNALALRLRLAGVRVTFALHEVAIHFSASPVAVFSALAQRLHVALLALAANEILVNTWERAATLRAWMPWRAGRIRYRPNASNIPVAPLGPGERDALRARHGASADTLVVASFGNFAEAKRYEFAVDAVAQLRNKVDARLWLIGDWTAADAGYIRRLCEQIRQVGLEEFTHWTGPLAADEVSAYLQAADVFVLPQPDGDLTRSGAFMAAAAHGLAVIAVSNPANQAEFTHAENVWLAEFCAADRIAQALEALAAPRGLAAGLRERLGRNLRGLYERRFDWPVMTAASREPAIQARAEPGREALVK